jgi:hypothetical protein
MGESSDSRQQLNLAFQQLIIGILQELRGGAAGDYHFVTAAINV